MPIGSVEFTPISSITEEDQENSKSQSGKGENVNVTEETTFIPSRLIDKEGQLNIKTKQILWWNPFLYKNAIRLGWGWVVLIYITGFLVSWLIFALIYWVLQKYYESSCNSSDCQTDILDQDTICVAGIESFNGALLYSMEVQSTIGYGSRALQTGGCYLHVIVFIIQSWFGLIIVTITTGILLSKFTNPGNTTRFIKFSKEALVSIQDRSLYLTVRAGEVSNSKIVGTTVSALMFNNEKTEEGEVINANPSTINFSSDYVPLLWPNCISHKIDNTSPLFNVSPKNLKNLSLEIVVWLSGKREKIGVSVQTCTSYIAEEIVWGATFSQTIEKENKIIRTINSEDRINQYILVDIPQMSAKEMVDKAIIDG